MAGSRLTRDQMAACVLSYPALRGQWKDSRQLMGEFVTAHADDIAATVSGELAPWGETGTLQRDEMGGPAVSVAVCGHCGKGWNDALITSITPVPAARCPFEYDHAER